MLQPYLVDGKPSDGYRDIADLIVKGFFDVIITFNFDLLLERALDDANFRDYKVLIRGEIKSDELERLVTANGPRVKILKMHGSLESSDYFLFSSLEMLNYPEEIRNLLMKLTGRDIIICGYGFNDRCVERAFNDSEDSGDIYYVNPGGAGQGIRPYLIRRRSKDRVMSGELGRFDTFFRALHSALTIPVKTDVPHQRQNLFKFLDYYQEDHKAWFFGRRRLTRTLVELFDSEPPRVLFLYGMPKVGKTSFVRAGLIPHLNPDRFEVIYVRGKRDLEPHLRAQLAARYGQTLATWTGTLSVLISGRRPPNMSFFLSISWRSSCGHGKTRVRIKPQCSDSSPAYSPKAARACRSSVSALTKCRSTTCSPSCPHQPEKRHKWRSHHFRRR